LLITFGKTRGQNVFAVNEMEFCIFTASKKRQREAI